MKQTILLNGLSSSGKSTIAKPSKNTLIHIRCPLNLLLQIEKERGNGRLGSAKTHLIIYTKKMALKMLMPY